MVDFSKELEKSLHADFCLVAGGRFELPVEPDFHRVSQGFSGLYSYEPCGLNLVRLLHYEETTPPRYPALGNNENKCLALLNLEYLNKISRICIS